MANQIDSVVRAETKDMHFGAIYLDAVKALEAGVPSEELAAPAYSTKFISTGDLFSDWLGDSPANTNAALILLSLAARSKDHAVRLTAQNIVAAIANGHAEAQAEARVLEIESERAESIVEALIENERWGQTTVAFAESRRPA